MEMSREVVGDAWFFARRAHEGQLDDGGNDYFESHCYTVYEIIEIVALDDYNLQAAALLHDTIEDTNTTYETLVTEFGEDIANLVHEVTHERRADDKGWYFPRLKSLRGMQLKFADRLSNLSRMEGVWDEKRIAKYMAKSKFWDIDDNSVIEGVNMSILEVLRETIWIWLSVTMAIVLYTANIITIEIATDIVLFVFVVTIVSGLRDMSSSDND